MYCLLVKQIYCILFIIQAFISYNFYLFSIFVCIFKHTIFILKKINIYLYNLECSDSNV